MAHFIHNEGTMATYKNHEEVKDDCGNTIK